MPETRCSLPSSLPLLLVEKSRLASQSELTWQETRATVNCFPLPSQRPLSATPEWMMCDYLIYKDPFIILSTPITLPTPSLIQPPLAHSRCHYQQPAPAKPAASTPAPSAARVSHSPAQRPQTRDCAAKVSLVPCYLHPVTRLATVSVLSQIPASVIVLLRWR